MADQRRTPSYNRNPDKAVCALCGNVECYPTEDCGSCDKCKHKEKFGGPSSGKGNCRRRQCNNFSQVFGKETSFPESQFDDNEDYEQAYLPAEVDISTSKNSYEDDDKDVSDRSIPLSTSQNIQRSEKQERSKSPKEKARIIYIKKEEALPQQCSLPGCSLSCRPTSKYCSEECGMKLMRNRILATLSGMSQQSPSVADENNIKALVSIQLQQQAAKDRLSELESKREALEKLIDKAKTTAPATDNTEVKEELLESSMYCVTCGRHIGTKNAMRHMEDCFNKHERMLTWSSPCPATVLGHNIFCNFFDTKHKSYCRRLKIMCPVHSVEPKVSDDEVCGFPLYDGVFKLSGDFCRALKKVCLKHLNWEKLRRGEIQLEKLRVLLKLEDLRKQECSHREQLANRHVNLETVLHKTTVHDLTSE